MQEERPAEKRTLSQEIQQEAQRLLRNHFGDDVEITDTEIFSSPKRRNVLARIELKSSSTDVPQSIIFKQSLPRKEDPDYTEANDRFSRDWAGLEFANNIDQSSHNVPKFFGGSKENRFILIEDLGKKHVSLVDSLLVPNNSDSAIPALQRYMSALGKFHASGFGRTSEYLEILNYVNDNAKTPPIEFMLNSDNLFEGLESANGLLKMSMTSQCREEVEQVLSALFKPGPFTVLIHGDIAPDNVFDHEPPKGLQLIDFELAAVRNALLDGTYLRMCIPTGWCAKALPNDVINDLEKIYRSELAKNIPDAKDDTRYNTAYTQACAFWALQEMAHLRAKFKEDEPWGGLPPGTPEHLVWNADNNSGRSRFLSRLQAFIDVANTHDMLPNIKEMAIAMLAAINEKRLWPDAKPLAFYPAFSERPVLANISRTSSTGDIAKGLDISPDKLSPKVETKSQSEKKNNPSEPNPTEQQKPDSPENNIQSPRATVSTQHDSPRVKK